MVPAYSYTEYTSPSGNIQIYIVRHKKNAIKVSARNKETIKQKYLGAGLIAIGLIGCMIFPEDCGGALLACVMGILRMVF
jgi:hypothetical protein